MLPWPGLPVTVMSTHIDMFGHVNHTRYLEYMEWARFAWAAHLGMPLPELVRDEGIGPAIIRATLSFRRECRLGDELLVTVRVVSAAAASAGCTRTSSTATPRSACATRSWRS